jgi:hypothetical protein
MQNIEEKVINNYNENMNYFKINYPALHNRLLALETILNDGSYKQKYDLEYKDGYFDIVELASNSYLYNQNSEKFSDELTNQITFKKNDQTFKSHRKVLFGKQMRELLKEQNTYTQYKTTADITDYYYENTEDSMSMRRIEKFIFLGSGLGIHIEKITKKFNLQVILLVEDDIELFRLSLFITNYSHIFLNKKVFFSISNNISEFHQEFNNFYVQAFFKNQYIKFNIFSSGYESKIQEIRSLLITRPEATYSHERLLVKNSRVIDKLKKNYKFLNLQKDKNENYFSKKPWLVLGAGPSLQQNSQWLIENQNKFIIVAAFTALNTLKRLNIKADIAVQIDENDFTTDQMLEKLDDLSFLDSTLIFFSASVSKLLFDRFDKERVYLHEDRTRYKLSTSTLTVASVGETVYSLALIYNASDIYLLGIDLALGADGQTHSKDHFKATTLEENAKQNENDDFQLSNTTIDVKGNFRDIVQTTPLFALSIPVINYKTKEHRSPSQKLYNLSDGAYLENIVPTKVDEVNLTQDISEDKDFNKLSNFFNKYSTTSLNDEEKKALQCRLKQIEEYYNILEEFKNSPHSNEDIFLASYIKFVSSMCNHSCSLELKELITIYFLRIASFIDDFVNTKEIKNKKKHIKKFKSFLVEQVNNIIKIYEEDLKKITDSQV